MGWQLRGEGTLADCHALILLLLTVCLDVGAHRGSPRPGTKVLNAGACRRSTCMLPDLRRQGLDRARRHMELLDHLLSAMR